MEISNAFTRARTNARELPCLITPILDERFRHLFPPDFIVCSELFDLYIIHKVLEIFQRTHISGCISADATAENVAANLGFAPQAVVPIRWMMDKIRTEGMLRNGPLFDAAPERYKREILSINKGCSASFAIVDELSDRALEYFLGQTTGEQILFAPNRIPLWADYFSNSHTLYAVNNRLAAQAVQAILPPGNICVLELGAGFGSAAMAVAEVLAATGDLARVESYTLSDIVPAFLRRCERTFEAAYPTLPATFRKIDINVPLTAQGIARESVDVVYAVNTIHIATDLQQTLGYILEVLKPRGAAVLSECIRPYPDLPIYPEFIFNFLSSFREVRLHAKTRPVHGFLTPANWTESLAQAGFQEINVVPNVAEIASVYPYFLAAAVSGIKTRQSVI
jgi:SAM-dependent methyltransferase